MQWKDFQNNLADIHRYLCDFWADIWHSDHNWSVSMQEHSYPVNISGQKNSHSQIHIVAWHSLKEGKI